MKILKKIIEEMSDVSWQPIDVVEIVLVDSEKNHYVIKGEEDGYKYLWVNGGKVMDHYLLNQTTSYPGDMYGGYELLPLGKGKYLKVSYSC